MEGFKGLFTSGNCNTQGQVGSNANQFKQFMGTMNQTTPQLGRVQQGQNPQNLDQLIQDFDRVWLTQQNNFQQSLAQRQAKAPTQVQSQKPLPVWNADFVSSNFIAMQQAQSQMLSQKAKPAPVSKCPYHSVKFNEVVVQPENQKEKESREKQEEEEGLASARALIQMMENDGSEKFRESDFLKFLKKIDSGKVRIKDNQLISGVEGKEETIDEMVDKNFEVAFAEAEEEFIKEQKVQAGKSL